MKKLLLVSNYVFTYRTRIYNKLSEAFKKEDLDFIVLSNMSQESAKNCKFKLILKSFSIIGYIEQIKKINPDYIIIFLHLKDTILIPVILYSKLKKIPIIYWGHGIDRLNPKSIKNLAYYFIHDMSDAIITYFPNCVDSFKSKNRKKIFIANNCLNYDYFPQNVYDKTEFREKYKIKENKIILFVGRIYPKRKLEVLFKLFKGSEYAVVVVGSGLTPEMNNIIEDNKNFYYLGSIYDEYEINSIYANCDIFCIPGANGLAINQALYWGKPVITIKGLQGPETYLIKNGFDGFIVDNEQELKEKIIFLLEDDNAYKQFSENSKKIVQNEANIEKMINGFLQAIEYCS